MDSCDSTGRSMMYGEKKQNEISSQPSMRFI